MDRSLAVTLAIAAVAHVIAIGVVRPYVRQVVAPEVIESSQVTIDQVAIELPAAEPAPALGSPPPAPHVAIVTTPGKPRPTVSIEVPAALPSPSGGPVPPAHEPAPTPVAASKIPSLINLDAPGSHAVIFPASSADVPASKEKVAASKLDAQLKSALDAKDTQTGSGFGGPVVSAAHSAAAGSTSLGWATFDVSTDALGTVTVVRVVDFGGGDVTSWQSVAKGIHATLGGARLKVPSGAAGVAVRVRVEANMKYPSGGTAPVSAIAGGGIGGAFDLADIGQPKRRVVSVRIISEQRI